jgi:hypothetical protein
MTTDTIGFGRNVGDRAAPLDLPADCVRVVTLVRVQDLARRKPRQKFRARSAIGDLAACECERERTAFCVRSRTMGLHGRAVDQDLLRWPSGLRERVKQVDPDASCRPADVAVDRQSDERVNSTPAPSREIF